MKKLRALRNKITMLSLALLTLGTGSCYGKIIKIFVSVNGNDKWSGSVAVVKSPDGPLQTLQGAINALAGMKNIVSGDSVVILMSAGTYYIDKTITITQGLPFNNSLTITKYGNGEVKISGFKKAESNRVKANGKYWEIDVNDNSGFVSQLKVNDRIAKAPVYPASDWLTLDSVSQTILKKGINAGTLSDSALQVLNIDPAITAKLKESLSSNAEVEIFSKWYYIRRPVKEISNSKLLVTGQEMPRLAPWKAGTRIRIVNSALGFGPGNWIFNKKSKKIYYYPNSGETLATVSFYIPATGCLFTIKGTSTSKTINNVYISDITFEGSGYDVSNKGILPMQAAATYDAAVEVDNARNINFRNCAFSNISLTGLWLNQSVLNSTIDGCYFNNLGIGGIKIGEPKPSGVGVKLPVTSANIVSNSIIQNGGALNPAGVGIAIFQSGKNVVRNNEVSDFYYSGLSVGWTWGSGNSYAVNNLIMNNHIHHIGKGVLDDMGGIYLLGNSNGTIVKDNIIDHIYSYDYGGWGIYLDLGAANIMISGNVILNTKSGGYFQSNAMNINVSDNVFCNSDIHQLQFGLPAPASDTSVFFHNNYIVRQTGEWFAGAWNSKGVYLKDNTFITGNSDKSNDRDNLKIYALKDVNSKFNVFNSSSVMGRDDYSISDIRNILNALKINKDINAGTVNNKWNMQTNSNSAGHYKGFDNRMKTKTIFRKDQNGR